MESGVAGAVGANAVGGHYETEEIEVSIRGRNYKAANGAAIKNYGQRRTTGATNQGK